jgi:precorrin-6A synthase
MRQVIIIGIGAGDPDYMTVQAIESLNQADVIFFFDKGGDGEDLLRLRRDICARFIEHDRYRIVEVESPERNLAGPVYGDAVASWHEQRIELYERLLSTELADGHVGAFLVWGDPAFYDSTLRILEAVRTRSALEFELTVIPGISAIQALAARHKIPLTPIGGSVLVTTARELIKGWPDGIDDVVVMLDSGCSFRTLDDPGTTIYWGAYLGTPDEILVSGTIEECGEEIELARAKARDRKGWIFDTYLLRKTR